MSMIQNNISKENLKKTKICNELEKEMNSN